MLTSSEQTRKHNLSLGIVRVLSGILLILSTASYSAAQRPPVEGGGPGGGPPPEAYTACEALKQNDVCSVETPRGTLNGSCQIDRRKQSVLLCVPEHRGPREKGDKRERQDNGSESRHGPDDSAVDEQ